MGRESNFREEATTESTTIGSLVSSDDGELLLDKDYNSLEIDLSSVIDDEHITEQLMGDLSVWLESFWGFFYFG